MKTRTIAPARQPSAGDALRGLTIADESIDPLPKTHQLRQQLCEAIRQGRLAPGAKLPTARALAATLGVNYRTVHQAMAGLVDEGWLVRYRRRGTFVKGVPPQAITLLTGIVCPTSVLALDGPPGVRAFLTLYEQELARRDLPHRYYMVGDEASSRNVMRDDLLTDVQAGRLGALIFPDCMTLRPLAEQLDRAGAAVVAYSSFADVRHRVSVDVEHFIHHAAAWLVAQGRRRLGYVLSLSGSNSPPRNVVRQLIEQAGATVVDKAMVGRPSSIQGGHDAARALDLTAIDGLIVPDDFIARGVADFLAGQAAITPQALTVAAMWTRENGLTYPWPVACFERQMALAVHDVAEMVQTLLAGHTVHPARRAHRAAPRPMPAACPPFVG